MAACWHCWLLLVTALLAYASTRPDTFRVERSISINAPPDKLFNYINDLHQFGSWSPWEAKDPQLKRNYSGAASGVGAVYAWQGNSDVGEGRMEITQSVPGQRIVMDLQFIKPFANRHVSVYTFTQNGAATTLSWAMDGPTLFVAKVMGIFISMDRMIGKDFEVGLANLKKLAEK